MTDFRVLRTLDGVELVPVTPAALAFLEPHGLDGVEVNRWFLTRAEWPGFAKAIAARGLTTEEALKRVLLPQERVKKWERYAVWSLGIGFLLICLGLAIKALWSL